MKIKKYQNLANKIQPADDYSRKENNKQKTQLDNCDIFLDTYIRELSFWKKQK